MKHFLTILILVISTFNLWSQSLHGTWKGVLIPSGKSIEEGIVVYAEFNINNQHLTGKMREEIPADEAYAIKQLKGKIKDNQLDFSQFVIEKSTRSKGTKWCRLNGSLTLNEATGYLKGTYTSSDCKRFMGEIILFRESFSFPDEELNLLSDLWFLSFQKDYKMGLNAPEIRKKERDNFVFEPIFFDYDEWEIRPEHYPFLNRLIHVVMGHSDLRVKVIGHTDADGSDQYNYQLSRKRAESIIDYFVRHGLERDRLEFDFKGERQPVDSNTTKEGRQRNRRVDFQFI